jgi:hypothetical protein
MTRVCEALDLPAAPGYDRPDCETPGKDRQKRCPDPVGIGDRGAGPDQARAGAQQSHRSVPSPGQ